MILIIKHIQCEGPGTLGDFLHKAGLRTKFIEFEKGEPLPRVDKCRAVISLGGPMNVYEEDKYPFLKEEDEFIKKIIKAEIPFLGICLGAQLLAKACGAKVKKNDQNEIGWYDLKLTNEGRNDKLFKGLPPGFMVFQWHGDTFDIPEESFLLAETSTCKNQAFNVGKNAYGLQFHVEVTKEIILSWLKEYLVEGQKEITSKNILQKTDQLNETFNYNSCQIYQNFLKII